MWSIVFCYCYFYFQIRAEFGELEKSGAGASWGAFRLSFLISNKGIKTQWEKGTIPQCQNTSESTSFHESVNYPNLILIKKWNNSSTEKTFQSVFFNCKQQRKTYSSGREWSASASIIIFFSPFNPITTTNKKRTKQKKKKQALLWTVSDRMKRTDRYYYTEIQIAQILRHWLSWNLSTQCLSCLVCL